MTKTISTIDSPSQAELSEKQRHLDELESRCSSLELEQRTLATDINSFRNRYYLRVGVLYAQLDDIRAKIFAALADENPSDAEARKKSEDAAKHASESAKEVNAEAQKSEPTPFRPSSHLKNAYRNAVRLIHPDRANDDRDRQLRDRLMADLNYAYRQHDIETPAGAVARAAKGQRSCRMFRKSSVEISKLRCAWPGSPRLAAVSFFLAQILLDAGLVEGLDEFSDREDGIAALVLPQSCQKRSKARGTILPAAFQCSECFVEKHDSGEFVA